MMQSSNLVPEEVLMESISPLWRKRFEQALQLLHTSLDQPFNWADIARQCAASPNYFHVMFKTVFGETPAAYQRRARMKQVLLQLCFEPEKSVTDIALDAGFSTSQNLAKVLQRMFGKSAREIRQADPHNSYNSLRQGLEHYVNETSMESSLSRAIQFDIVASPEQFLYLETCTSQNSDIINTQWKKLAPREVSMAVSLSPCDVIYDISLPYQIGYYCDEAQANHHIAAHHFLRCTVKVRDSQAYLAAWESMISEVLQQGYEVVDEVGLLEHFHNPRDYFAFSAEITLLLAIRL